MLPVTIPVKHRQNCGEAKLRIYTDICWRRSTYCNKTLPTLSAHPQRPSAASAWKSTTHLTNWKKSKKLSVFCACRETRNLLGNTACHGAELVLACFWGSSPSLWKIHIPARPLFAVSSAWPAWQCKYRTVWTSQVEILSAYCKYNTTKWRGTRKMLTYKISLARMNE